MIKGSLLLIAPIVKRFQAILWQILMFMRINTCVVLNLSFITPKRTFLRDFTSFVLSHVKSISGSDLYASLK